MVKINVFYNTKLNEKENVSVGLKILNIGVQ